MIKLQMKHAKTTIQPQPPSGGFGDLSAMLPEKVSTLGKLLSGPESESLLESSPKLICCLEAEGSGGFESEPESLFIIIDKENIFYNVLGENNDL